MRATFASAVLFLSSYAPLFVALGLLDSFNCRLIAYACYGVAAASVVALWLAFRSWRQLATAQVTVARARHRDADAIAYVATYIVPFASLGVDTLQERIALAGFVLLVAVLYIQAHLFYVNPLLALVGFRLFEVEADNGRLMLVISRKKYLQTGTALRLHTLSDYVFLEALERSGS